LRDYDFLRKNLRWDCEGDGLYRDGSDHYQIDSQRFERASRVIGSTAGLVIADFGSFPGFGIWAFRDCRHYIGLGKCPDWYQAALKDMNVEWIEHDFESPELPPMPSLRPDVVLLQEVIEHIRQPKKFLKKLYEWMPEGARLYVTTNNLNYVGYILKQLAGREIFDPAVTEDSVYPGHCTYYSLRGLADLLVQIGFECRAVSRQNFLPAARFYRRRNAAILKNLIIRSVPGLYATHIELLCEKRRAN
jgi:SAM-dependent methyltransferase